MDDIRNDLNNTTGDYIHSAIKTVLSAIPFAGSAASELFSLLVTPPMSKRRDDWIIRVYEGLEQIKSTRPNFDIDSLRDNELFITTVLQATQATLRNHQAEKLASLRNAVMNCALNIQIEENVQLMFLNLIDTLTPLHLRFLDLFNDPTEWFVKNGRAAPDRNASMGSVAQLINTAFQELNGKQQLSAYIVKDLYARSLVNTETITAMTSGYGMMSKISTDLGSQFISYIKDPLV